MGVRDRMSSTARKSTEEYDDEGAMKVDTSSSVKNDNMTSEMTVKDISVLISEESNATLFDSKSSAKLGGEHHSNEKEKLEEG
ncbi:hypothetical protein SARC_13722 [Sphaeroforma arctica JP610]|uniref:Uncharacterized protein n=1 Tax=Sphaeroforma arctica JP610 TaxID=667725 RepID=A0A0L0FB44_9EUKA|nr:hypothetical protein SARC_13722 [Sphaeroforma arctica JP610]KNC73721.1 hypothetical protein SARC_13722 [Sphaeroforma arctica JP610]|eukprot:XP_014147623.1 hypothetical protein SARC_13722 [Sphaeroforma arctica JP610]